MMKKRGESDAERYGRRESRVLGDQMGNKGKERVLKDSVWISSFGLLGIG